MILCGGESKEWNKKISADVQRNTEGKEYVRKEANKEGVIVFNMAVALKVRKGIEDFS